MNHLVDRTRTGRPRIRQTADIIDLWVERIVASPRELAECEPHADKDSMSFRGDKLYHYGHFTLAQVIRDRRERPKLILLNGDTYSGAGGWGPSTSSRQSEVRSAVAGLDVPSIILPFSTLEAAGVDLRTVVPVHVRPDRRTYHEVFTSERPGPFVKVEHPDGLTEMVPEQRHGYVHRETGEPRGSKSPLASDERDRYEWRPYMVEVEKAVLVDDETRAEVQARPAHGWVSDYATLQPDGRWKYTVERHWLGDSLFKGSTTERRSRKAKPDEDRAFREWLAFKSLANDMRDRAYQHDGEDAIIKWALYQQADERARAAQPEFQASMHDGEVWISFTVTRTAHYLSSFDYGEPHAPYFMCELPRSFKGETVEDAIDALMPDDVRAAVGAGLDVVRQGDIFAIPTAYTTDELESRAKTTIVKRFEERPAPLYSEQVSHVVSIRRFKANETYTPGACDIHGTNHSVTHLIVTKDGEQYGRGRMYHTPGAWRTADHRVVELGDRETWYRLVKNTVPLAKGAKGSPSLGRVFQSGQSRAWTLGGMVD